MQRTVLGQRTLHGAEKLGARRCGLAAKQLLQCARLLCHERGGHYMAARAGLLIGLTAAAGGAVRAENNFLARGARHNITQRGGAGFQHAHAAPLIHGFAGVPLFLAREHF